MIRSWRLVLRIARRDMLRAPGRSLLIVALLGLPMLVITIGATTVESLRPTPAEQAIRDMGSADAMVDWRFDAAVVQDPLDLDRVIPAEWLDGTADRTGATDVVRRRDDYVAVLPEGTRMLEVTAAEGRIVTPAAVRQTYVIGVDAADPMTRGMFGLHDGTWPEPGEVAVSAALAADLGLGVGDAVHVDGVGSDRRVAAIVERPARLSEEFVVTPQAPRPGRHVAWLVDTPEPIEWADVLRYNETGMSVYSRHVATNPPPSPLMDYVEHTGDDGVTMLSLASFGVGLVILEIVLLAGPAFTIGAQRRTREFAMLAANGATPAQLRRIVLAGGLLLGTVAAVTATAAGLAIAYVARPLSEAILDTRLAGFRPDTPIIATAVVLVIASALLAALAPAWMVGRRPVVAGLAHRPARRRRRVGLLTTGAGLIATGTVVTWLGSGTPSVPVMLTGIALGEVGLVLCAPSLVGVLGGLGRVLPLSPRIALRHAARNRGSTAPAIAAVMAVVGVGLAMTMFAAGEHRRQNTPFEHGPATGTAVVDIRLVTDEGTAPPNATTVSDVIGLMRRHLPIGSLHRLDAVSCATSEADLCTIEAVPPDDRACAFDDTPALAPPQQAAAARDPACTARVTVPAGRLAQQNVIIGEDDVAAVTGLSGAALDDARAAIADGGVIVPSTGLIDGDTATIIVRERTADPSDGDAEAPRATIRVPAFANAGGAMADDQVLFSRAAADDLGLVARGVTVIGVPSRQPDGAETDRFGLELRRHGVIDPAVTAPSTGAVIASIEYVTAPESTTVIALLWFTGGLGIVLALGATAVATALTAAESRRELATLAAIGASPGLRRRLSLFQAGVIALLGALLGVTTGVGACVAAMSAMNATYAARYPRESLFEIDLPWPSIGVALVAVPLIAMLGAGLLTRSQLPIERRTT